MARSTQTATSKGSGEGAGSPRRQNRTLFLVAGITALVILAIAAFAVLSATGGGDARSFTPNDQGLLPVGSQAPGFTAETVGGGEVSVGEGDGEATMLVFFATWCPHCNDEAPIISELEGQYEDLRVVMVGIDDRDDPGKVREFVERYGIEGPATYQPSLGDTHEVSGYPTTYVLNDEGGVVAAHSGEAPRDVYEGWVQEAIGSGG
jgi:cytochrome c biogenesis protein CcmG, thiol:disulfide interchange protein DsbE